MKIFFRLSLATAVFALLLGFAANPARAGNVTFSTAGCFGAGCVPAPVATTNGSGSASVVFAMQPTTTVNTSTPSGFSTADLGTFVVSGLGTFSNTAFNLRVNQTAPSGGSGNFTGLLSGTLIQNGSDTKIVFSNTNLMIGSVTYQLVNLTNGNTLKLDPNATGGITRISADISTVPEPASMLLLGTGLAGIGGALRKRRNKQSK